MKEQKRSPKTIDIVSYALKVSENGVTCVFVFDFRSSGNWLNSSHPHVHQNMCGNNFILHKALTVRQYLGSR